MRCCKARAEDRPTFKQLVVSTTALMEGLADYVQLSTSFSGSEKITTNPQQVSIMFVSCVACICVNMLAQACEMVTCCELAGSIIIIILLNCALTTTCVVYGFG